MHKISGINPIPHRMLIKIMPPIMYNIHSINKTGL